MKKIVILLLTLIVGWSFFGTSVSAVSSSITLTDIDLVTYISGLTVRIKKSSKNEFVYCIQANKGRLYKGDKLTLDGTIDDAGVVYLAANGYPNKSITGKANKDYYITQIAIWLYYREVYKVPTSKLDNFVKGKYDKLEITKHIKTLYEGALKAHKTGFINPSLDVNANNELKFNEDKTLLTSSAVTINLVGADNYTVTIDNNTVGAYITDLNGNKKTTFKKNDKFLVKVPGENVSKEEGLHDLPINITVKANGIVDKAYRYKPGTTSKQNVLSGALLSTVINLSKNVSFFYKTQEVVVSKVDFTNGKELAGAHLEIHDSNDNLVVSWISTGSVYKIKLAPGEYTLIETQAPNGYELSTEVVAFTVDENGATPKVIMKNMPFIDVPKTALDASSITLIVGASLLLFGLGMVYINVKKSKI